MENPLKIAMIAAEAVPYAKAGGLADVVGALPTVLQKLASDTIVIIPAYKAIHQEKFGVRPFERIPQFSVPMGPGLSSAQVFRAETPPGEPQFFFIGNKDYFFRDGIYDDPITKEGYPDNMERFLFFMKASLEVIRRLGEPIDVIHCHDSQTGLIPGYLRTNLRSDPFFARTGTLFTMHNLGYQGVYPKESLYWAGIDYRHFYPNSPFEFWAKVNFMKVGIECADLINTVSETYAAEIQSSAEYGYGLEGVLRLRREDLYGIVNGIDYAEWNPETDPLIPAHYSAADLSGKTICKTELLRTLGLPPPDGRTPLIGIVSRLVDQKGMDLIAESIEQIAKLNLQLVVLGTGQQKYHDMFEFMARRYPNKISIKLAFDNRVAHQIEAGSDIFLMPSKYEPCGLNQLYSLRYGTVPVVRATGGLADTVADYDPAGAGGTGFRFEKYSASDMMIALNRALKAYSDAGRWRELMLRGMAQNWSWEESARRYLKLYRLILQKRISVSFVK